MEKVEKIGKVTLDYTFYSGEDLYSEGSIEDELLEVVENHTEDEFGPVINAKNEWSYLYHLSQVRQNIVSWIPMKKNAKILEIGSGCGAITGALAKKGGRVDCVELSRKRSLINANRNRDCEGVTVKVGNFETIEPHLDDDYDVITLIGVWEYAGVYLSAENPHYRFLELLKKHLKPEGKVIIAIENKYGLKYWAGCREDHTAMFFEGLEGYTRTNDAVTFGKNEMQQIFEDTGYQAQFYYPYPDYKLPLHIFSDAYLPEKGMLGDNGKNLDNTRMVLFDEGKVFDSLIQDKMFPYFSNSFLVILQKEKMDEEESVIYSKYSNERNEAFRIRTDIVEDAQGRRVVRKYPMHKNAEKHIDKIYDMYCQLEKENHNPSIQYNVCRKAENAVEFEYIEGQNLGQILHDLILSGAQEKAKKMIGDIVSFIREMANTAFRETDEFREVFGACSLEGIPAIKGADIDLIFSNIISREDSWGIIDYEWSFDFAIPVNYILYRVLYFQAPEEIRSLNLCAEYGITSEEETVYEQMEDHFMHYVYKNQVLISDSQIIKSKYVINDQMIAQHKEDAAIKVYYDYSDGLSEQNTDYIFYDDKENINIEIPINKAVTGIRIDPMETSGIVTIKEIEAGTKDKKYRPDYVVNGYQAQKNFYLFETNDPWIYLEKLKRGTEYVRAEFSLEKISQEMLEKISRPYMKTKFRNLKKSLLK